MAAEVKLAKLASLVFDGVRAGILNECLHFTNVRIEEETSGGVIYC